MKISTAGYVFRSTVPLLGLLVLLACISCSTMTSNEEPSSNLLSSDYQKFTGARFEFKYEAFWSKKSPDHAYARKVGEKSYKYFKVTNDAYKCKNCIGYFSDTKDVHDAKYIFYLTKSGRIKFELWYGAPVVVFHGTRDGIDYEARYYEVDRVEMKRERGSNTKIYRYVRIEDFNSRCFDCLGYYGDAPYTRSAQYVFSLWKGGKIKFSKWNGIDLEEEQ